MTRYGHTLMGEQSPPDQLVADAAQAERAGFDFVVVSDQDDRAGRYVMGRGAAG